MPSNLITQAINAALNYDWHEAIKINLAILDENEESIEALNRLAHAYKESGNIKLAQKIYRRVLTLDRFNPIANKNLKLLESLPKSFKKEKEDNHGLPCQAQFLEEPGKTKIVSLVNLAPCSVILGISCGTPVGLEIKRRSVVITSGNGTYLAALPDDLSAKLIKFLKAGNKYEAFVKTVGKNNLSIFIREICRGQRFKNQPTFSVALGKTTLSKRTEDELGTEEETENETETESEIVPKTTRLAEPVNEEEALY